jgi:hypothetical protein
MGNFQDGCKGKKYSSNENHGYGWPDREIGRGWKRRFMSQFPPGKEPSLPSQHHRVDKAKDIRQKI